MEPTPIHNLFRSPGIFCILLLGIIYLMSSPKVVHAEESNARKDSTTRGSNDSTETRNRTYSILSLGVTIQRQFTDAYAVKGPTIQLRPLRWISGEFTLDLNNVDQQGTQWHLKIFPLSFADIFTGIGTYHVVDSYTGGHNKVYTGRYTEGVYSESFTGYDAWLAYDCFIGWDSPYYTEVVFGYRTSARPWRTTETHISEPSGQLPRITHEYKKYIYVSIQFHVGIF